MIYEQDKLGCRPHSSHSFCFIVGVVSLRIEETMGTIFLNTRVL